MTLLSQVSDHEGEDSTVYPDTSEGGKIATVYEDGAPIFRSNASNAAEVCSRPRRGPGSKSAAASGHNGVDMVLTVARAPMSAFVMVQRAVRRWLHLLPDTYSALCESLEDEFRKRLIDKEKFPTRRTGLVPNNEHRPLAGPVPRTFFALKSRGGRNKPRPLVSAPIFVIKCWSN